MPRNDPHPRRQDQAGKISFLKQVLLFAAIDEPHLATMADDFHWATYRRGETLFRQGDHSRELYIIVEGKIRIFKISHTGGETSINIFFPTDVIGEFAAIDGGPRSAAAKIIEDCRLLVMTQEKFLHHLETSPALALGMTKVLTRKLRWTAAYAETVAQYDAAGRLLHILLVYNEQYGRSQGSDARWVLDLALNQADLASLIGARREWVNRLLRDWRERQLIEYDNGTITFLDLPRVEAERDSRMEAKVRRW